MCVIAFSEKGKAAPTEEQIRSMFKKNPDGAGFAYNDIKDHNKVKFEKGFMDVEKLLKRLEPLEQWTDTNLAIHFRIGTAGKNDEKTCHPFPISPIFGDLQKTSGEGPVLFHNGVLDKGGYADPLSSDTQDFVIAMAPLFKKYFKSKTRDSVIEYAVEGSRVLVMYDNNKIKMYGKWKKPLEGDFLVSNDLWETYGNWYSTYSIDESYYPYGSDYRSGDYYGYSGQFAPSKTAEKKITELTEDKIASYWRELELNGYTWFESEDVMNQVLNSADELHGDMAMKNSIAYVFDEEQLIAYDMDMEEEWV